MENREKVISTVTLCHRPEGPNLRHERSTGSVTRPVDGKSQEGLTVIGNFCAKSARSTNARPATGMGVWLSLGTP